jgi:hypothetical protein
LRVKKYSAFKIERNMYEAMEFFSEVVDFVGAAGD